jgi:NADP-dependent 3-hydroxy acid dehydrogenase YdfG
MKANGKVIVVTGAGSGIGRELALLLLSKGASVAGVDLNAAALTETAALAADHKDNFEPMVANIADRQAVEQLPSHVKARFGTVDGVINNAGIIQPFVKVSALDYSAIERVINVNLLGTLYVTKSFLPALLERPEAHIVNLSSMGGFVPVPGQTIYCAAKAGVKLLSEGLASELIHTNVRVTVVFPGAIATNIAANSGLGQPSAGAKDSGAIKPLSPRAAAEIIASTSDAILHL